MVFLSTIGGCRTNNMEKQFENFLSRHVAQVEPLFTQSSEAWWSASTSGRKEDYQHLKTIRLEIRQIYRNAEEFAFLKKVKDTGQIKDPLLARQLDRLYRSYLKNQIPPDLSEKLISLDAQIAEKYNTFRGTIDGKRVTNSDIHRILTTETDSSRREAAWRASKQVGEVVVGDLLQLVRFRNQAARQLGFDNYHTLSLEIGEQNVKELDEIFRELEEQTREPFRRLKQELDGVLAQTYALTPGELMPWHYHDPFFQRLPLVFQLDLDRIYEKYDVKELARAYYAGIELPVDDVLARSDLYEREGKNPHAFSQDADRCGKVRVLCNLDNNERWMETVLHELGHAVYSKYHQSDLPYLLRTPAHSFTTEAVAMFFGRLSRNAEWMRQMLNLPESDYQKIRQVSDKYTCYQQILFSRWAMVMYYFEKQLYADPDRDLNALWWDLIENYQLLRRPNGPLDAGWASKLHFVQAPCYYHNYMLGELLASQLHHAIVHRVLKLDSDRNVGYVGDPRVGSYLRQNVLAPADRFHWNEMIRRATGEHLATQYFVRQFIP